jgi:hypothetical protein
LDRFFHWLSSTRVPTLTYNCDSFHFGDGLNAMRYGAARLGVYQPDYIR